MWTPVLVIIMTICSIFYKQDMIILNMTPRAVFSHCIANCFILYAIIYRIAELKDSDVDAHAQEMPIQDSSTSTQTTHGIALVSIINILHSLFSIPECHFHHNNSLIVYCVLRYQLSQLYRQKYTL